MNEKELGIDFENLVGPKELEAYQSYIKLTSYENVFLAGSKNEPIREDYSTRDFSFPPGLNFMAVS